jgi:hypothetical protein
VNALATATAGPPGPPWWVPAHGGGSTFTVPGPPSQAPWTTPPPGFVHTPFWNAPITPPGTVWWTPLTGTAPGITGAPSSPSSSLLSVAAAVGHDARTKLKTRRTSGPLRADEALTPGTKRRYSLYTPELNLLAETVATTASAPAIAHEYVWFGGVPRAQIETSTNTIHYYFNDHLGTPVLTTNGTGTVDWRIEREPYGKRYAVRTGHAVPAARLPRPGGGWAERTRLQHLPLVQGGLGAVYAERSHRTLGWCESVRVHIAESHRVYR